MTTVVSGCYFLYYSVDLIDLGFYFDHPNPYLIDGHEDQIYLILC